MIKLCKICGEAFDARGRTLTCSKECSRENRVAVDRKYYSENPEKLRSKARRWYKNNREKTKKKSKMYYAENLEKCRAGRRRWYYENHESQKEAKRLSNAIKTGKAGDALFFQTMQSLNAIAETAEKNT